MNKTLLLPPALFLAFLFSNAHAASDGSTKYVTDQITLGLHVKPDNNAGTIGLVKSGDRVTVLQSLGENSFARVRTADGSTGWVVARDLSDQPAARDQLDAMQKKLDDANTQIKSLQSKLDDAQAQLEKAKPALDLAAENDKLRASIKQREKTLAAMEQHYNLEKAHRDTLITGAILAGGGVIFGLLLPWLRTGRRRRRNEL